MGWRSLRSFLTMLLAVSVLLAVPLAGQAQSILGPVPILAVNAPLSSARATLYSTNLTLANLSTASSTTATLSYYKPDGSVWPTSPSYNSASLGPGASVILRQYADPAMPAGLGSGSIASAGFGSLLPVVQILARNGQVPSSGAYSRLNVSRSQYVPLVVRNLNSASGLSNSTLTIQNVTTAVITTTVQFVPGPGSAGTTFTRNDITIPPGASYHYDLAGETNLPNGFFGSAYVSGNPSIAQVAVVVNLMAGPNQLQTFGGFISHSTSGQDFFVYHSVPLFMSRLSNGTSTSLSIQNLSTAPINANTINVNCTDGRPGLDQDFTLTNPDSIPGLASFYVNPVTDMTLPADWYGSCVVDPGAAANDLGVLIQQRRPGASDDGAAYQAETFEVGGSGGSSPGSITVPLVAKRLANGFATAVTIQAYGFNLDEDDNPLPTTVNLRYIPEGGGTPILVGPFTIEPFGILIRNHRLDGNGANAEPALPDGWVGSLQITSDSFISGYVQLTNIIDQPGDNLMAHELVGLGAFVP